MSAIENYQHNDLSDPVIKEIVTARVKLLFERPFFGQLASRMIIVDASKWCATAATDGRHLYYNRDFIAKLSKPELLFLLAHEVLHCVYDHLSRRGNRDPKIWNMANDYIVNWTLVDFKVGSMPPRGLYNAQYTDEYSSEELYKIFEENSTKIEIGFDEHLDLLKGTKDDGEGDGNKTFQVTVMGKDGPPQLTEEDIQKIRNELRAQVIQVATGLSSSRVPKGVRRIIQELTEPKMDWRTMLDAHIRSSVKDDYTFNRLSRRTWGAGAILPSQNFMNTIDISVAVDTSGSMTEEMLRDLLSETKGIMQTFRDFKLKLWTFDTEVQEKSYKEFTPENIDEIDWYEPLGGGGTLFECNWEFMKEHGIEPARFVMFTDGIPNQTWGDEDYCDTLFIIHGSETIQAPFGVTAYYDKERPKT